jgi:PAS domain S-box-containing protein
MVRELVKLHSGSIKVSSILGQGSTFTVSLPLKNHHLDPSVVTENHNTAKSTAQRAAYVGEALQWIPDRSALASNDKSKSINHIHEFAKLRTVLLADDNVDMQRYVLKLLETDYNVILAGDGEEAYLRAIEHRPDLILSDIMMPQLDGFGLLQKLKSNLGTRNIPVIFLSARAGEEAKVEGLNAGADDYLTKPFSSRELLARVANHISISETRRKTEREFFNLFLQSPAHIHVFRGPEHIVEFFHPLGIVFTGRDITGMKIRDAMPALEGQGLFEMLDEVYLKGIDIHAKEVKASIKNDKGELSDYYFNVTYLPWKDLEGKIQGVLQFTFEITDTVTHRLLAETSEARFRLLATTLPQIVWTTNAEGKLDYLSNQWEEYTGQPVTEGLINFHQSVHEDDIAALMQKAEHALAAGEAWNAEYRLKNEKNGNYRWFYANILPLKNKNGQIDKWIGSAGDIEIFKEHSRLLEKQVQERTKELDELNQSLQKSNRELQQFAYISSHDMQEPLRKIQTFTEMVKNNIKDEQYVERYLSKIGNSAERMSTLIKDLLQYSQVTKENLSTEIVDLNEVLRNVKNDFELLIEQKEAIIQADPLPILKGNKLQFHQLFSNLINNALKFTTVNPLIVVTHEVVPGNDIDTLEPINRNATYHKLSLRDNGIGFEQQYAEQIFGLFNRLHNRNDYSGTGIGLALCKKIIETHQGIIKAISGNGEGATFEVYIPDKIPGKSN